MVRLCWRQKSNKPGISEIPGLLDLLRFDYLLFTVLIMTTLPQVLQVLADGYCIGMIYFQTPFNNL
jgi:hypothetical protein